MDAKFKELNNNLESLRTGSVPQVSSNDGVSEAAFRQPAASERAQDDLKHELENKIEGVRRDVINKLDEKYEKLYSAITAKSSASPIKKR